jgi:Protein of unknown function (DUF1557).
MMRSVSFIVSILFLNNVLWAGFVADTLIKAPTSYIAIKDIKTGDLVMGLDHNNEPVVKRVIHTCAYYFENVMNLTIDDQSFITSYGQRFYLPFEKKWQRARELRVGDVVLKKTNEHAVVTYAGPCSERVLLYDIGVEGRHNFFVSEHDMVVHNFVPIVIGLTWLFGIGSVEFAGATVGVAILGAAIGINLHKNRDGVDGQKDGGLRISFHGSPSPEDPEEFKRNHPHGKYEDAPYHHLQSKGAKSLAPQNGQAALDNSVFVKTSSDVRVGINQGEFVVLRKTSENLYHGYVLEWNRLDVELKNALIRAKMVNHRGKIL